MLWYGVLTYGAILHQLSNVDNLELGSVSDSVTSWTSGKSASEQFSPPPQASKSKPMIGPAMIGPAMIGPVGPLPVCNMNVK